MAKNALKWIAGVAWVAGAISMAAPADARAYSWSWGDYATCSANYNANFIEANCGGGEFAYFNYEQQIRFVNTSCNAGDCDDSGATYVDSPYSTGRKPAYQQTNCGGAGIFELGSCSC
jgi:hypothetical protein